MTTLMRNGRGRRSGKPVKGHAIVERVFLVGTRSADHIRASGHSGRIAMEASLQAKTGRIHGCTRTLRKTSDSSCTAGAVHTWPFATFRGSAAIGRFGGVATVGRISSSSVIYVLILGTVILYRLASSSGTREVRSWQYGEPPDEGRHCILYSQDRQLVGKWPLVGAVCHRDGPNRASGELDRCAPAIRQREV